MTTHRLCDLVWDANIYPRSSISEVNVSRLHSAIQSQAQLPPIVVEAKTLRILDGVHRWKAQTKALGAEASVDVIERECADDNEAFLLSIELNAAHGLTLTPFDITRNAVRAEERGIALELLARAVHVPIEKIERRLTTNTAFNRTLGIKTPLKGSMRALAGTELTEKQIIMNRISGGMTPVYYIRQVQSFIESGLIEWGSQNDRAALSELFAVLKNAMTSAA